MSFDIVVKLDPAQAAGAAKQVTAALDQVTQAEAKAQAGATQLGQTAATALTSTNAAATGAANATAALGTSASKASLAFSEYGMQLKNNTAVLERIQGPTRQLAADLRSVQELYKSGAISAAEYAVATSKMHQQMQAASRDRFGASPKPGGDSGDSGLGKIASAGSGVLSGVTGGALAATASFAGLAATVVKVEDSYTDLANAARRIVGANGDVNATIQQQLGLADRLHASLETTIGLTAALRDGTEDLHLTSRQLTTLTTEVGEAVQLSGHKMEDAGGVVARLSYAMEAGTITGRELKGLMREFPALGDAFSHSFGVSRKTLVDMANQGKITGSMLIDNLGKSAGDLDEKFSHMDETLRQKLGHAWDAFVAGSHGMDAIKKQIDELNKFGSADAAAAAREQADRISEYNEKTERAAYLTLQLDESISKATQTVRDGAGAIGGLTRLVTAHADAVQGAVDKLAAAKAFQADVIAQEHLMIDAAKNAQQVKDQIALGADKQVIALRGVQDAQLETTKATVSYGAIIADAHGKTLTLTRGLQDLSAAWHAGAVTATEYTDKLRELSPEFAFQDSLIHSITDTLEHGASKWTLSITALQSALKSGTITAAQFNDELAKMGGDKSDNRNLSGAGSAFGGAGVLHFVKPEGDFGATARAATSSMIDQSMSATGGFSDPLSGVSLYLQKGTDALNAWKTAAGDARTPTEHFLDDLKKLNTAQADSGGRLPEYEQDLRNLRDRYADTHDPAVALRKAVDDLDQRFKAGLVSTKSYNDQLRDLRLEAGQGTITDGLSKGLENINKQMDPATNATKLLEQGFNDVSTAITDMATKGTTDWRAMIQSMIAELGKLMLFGGLRSLFGGASDASLASDFLKGSFAPGFAEGGSFRIGGNSPSGDRVPVFFWGNSGEDVTIRNQNQQNQGHAGGGSAPVVIRPQIQIHNFSDPERAARDGMSGREGGIVIHNQIDSRRRTLANRLRR